MKSSVSKLLEELEKERKEWFLTDNDLSEFNKSWILNIDTRVVDAKWDSANNNIDELNKTWLNYKRTADNTANTLANIAFKEAEDKTAIEVDKTKVKNARSDETRKEFLENTEDFKDKQDTRYKEVAEITDQQERIANREANIWRAQAWQHWDIYSDSAMANIRNDIIQKYGKNILNAKQYELATNRTIDNDLLNVGLKELADKDKRDIFKNVLLDKDNSYILSAVSEAAAWNKKAVKDVETFFQTYTKLKADWEQTRSNNTERRDAFDKEFEGLSANRKGDMLRDLSFNLKWFALVADWIPKLIKKYPTLWIGQLKAKVAKMAELALTGKQQIATIWAIPEDDRTEAQKKLLQYYLSEWFENAVRNNVNFTDTSVLSAENNKTGNIQEVKKNAANNEWKNVNDFTNNEWRKEKWNQVLNNTNQLSSSENQNRADENKKKRDKSKELNKKLKWYLSRIEKFSYVNGKFKWLTKSQWDSKLKKAFKKKHNL